MMSTTPGALSQGTHSITIDGVRQVFHVAGTGPVCLVHPGGPGFGWEYMRMPALEQHLTMVYLEPIGTGDSGRLPDRRNYQIDTWMGFIHGVVEHLGRPKVFLLGHSYGGFISQRYVLHHADRLAGLILYATSPVLDAEFWGEAMANLNRFPQLHPDEPEAAGIPQAYREALNAPDDETITVKVREILPFYFANYWAHERDLAPVRATMRAWVDPLRGEEPAPFDVRDALGSITVPSLIITGEHDFLCSPRRSMMLHDIIPASRLTIVPDGGHMAHLEQPEAFTRAVVEFLQAAIGDRLMVIDGPHRTRRSPMGLREDAKTLLPTLAQLRRELHQIPEVGLHLPKTQQRVIAALDSLPLEVSTGKSVSSVTAVLRGGGPGPVVLLRADMDALPMQEQSDEAFASRHEGFMHACGHDLHTAGLVGAARLLCAVREQLTGDVVFMFQPGEEGFDGASYMIAEGVLEAAGRPADAAYGIHVLSSMLPNGVFASRPGPLLAASAAMSARVVGAGGHGSQPHTALDPIPAACEMVNALQTMVTRRFDVFDPVVITVGSFHAGTRRNVIPEVATFEATIRTFSSTTATQVREHAIRLCEGIAAAHGLTVEARCEDEYPVTINDETEYRFAADTARELFGDERCQELANPITGAEDFARVLAKVPGAYVFLGACTTEDPATAPTNHSPLATFDDAVLSDAAAFLAELTIRRLRRR